MPTSIHKRRVAPLSCRLRCSSAPALLLPSCPGSPSDARQEIENALAVLRRDSLEAFRKRWGFDAVAGEPTPEKHHTWQWTPISPPRPSSPILSPFRTSTFTAVEPARTHRHRSEHVVQDAEEALENLPDVHDGESA